MGRNTCSVLKCEKNSGMTNISLHRLPSVDLDTRNRWLEAAGDCLNKHRKQIYFCSCHFEECCFDRTGCTVRLRPGSYPTIFKDQDKQPNSSLPSVQDEIQKRLNCDLKKEEQYRVLKKARYINHDHTYVVRDIQKVYTLLKKTRIDLKAAQKTIRTLKEKVRKQKKRIKTLKETKENDLIKNENSLQTTNTNTEIEELLQRLTRNQEMDVTSTKKYDPALKTFALTLNLLSPKAYNYIRETFHNALPSRSTISNW